MGPPKYIKPLSDTALLQKYTVLPTGSKYIKPVQQQPNDNDNDDNDNNNNKNDNNDNNDNDDDSDDSDDNNNSNDNDNDHNEEEKNDNDNADNNIIEILLSNRNIKRESDHSFRQQTNKKIKISTNNEEKNDDFIFDSNGLFDNSVSDVSTRLFSDSDSDNEIENKEKNNRVKLAKLI